MRDRRRSAGEQAYIELFERHYTSVLAYALRRTEATTARDVTAETFLVAWRRQDEALAGGLPWLYRTAAFVLSNRVRADRRASVLAQRLAQAPRVDEADFAERFVETDRLHRAMTAALSEFEQELILLWAWEQLEPRELAVVLGSTRGSVSVRLHRARRKLHRALTSAPADELVIRSPQPEDR